MIYFNNIWMQNFISIGENAIKISLRDNPTTLIKGTNGAGKTTILDGTSYALFGKPLRPVKLGQLVNSINKRKMLVKCNFTVNGINYEVHRGQKPAIFEIYKDGEQVDALASVKDLQEKLEVDILGTNYKTFTQVITVASTGHKRFMELTPSERRVVVEQMLDIEVISAMSEKLKERYKAVRQKSSMIDGKLNRINQSIESQKRLIESVSSVSDEQIKTIDEQMVVLKGKDKELKDLLMSLKIEHDGEIAKMPDVNIAELNEAKSVLDKYIIDSNIDASEALRLASEAKNLAMFYTNNDSCDRCSQPIDVNFKQITIQNLKKTHDTNSILAANAYKEVEDHRDKLAKIQENLGVLSNWQQSCQLIINKANNIQLDIKNNQDHVRGLIDQKQTLINKGNQDTQSYYDELDKLNNEVKEVIDTRAEITEEMELCNLCSEMLKDKGLKAKIIKQYLPVINQSINDLLDVMGAHYSFVLDDQFNETIKSRYRDTFSYGSFSNGEKQRIDSAILFMWRKLAESKNTVSSNLLILDEVLDGSLDKDGIDNLFEIFATIPNSNIFIISHRPEIVDRFDSTIEVSKVGNFSQYNFN